MTRIFPAFFDHHDAPAHWASALVNGDYSGLTDQDKQELRNFLERENLSAGSCVACSEHSFTGKFDGLLTELLEYTFDTRGGLSK